CTRALEGSRARSRATGKARAASRAWRRCAAPAAAGCLRGFREEASCAWPRLVDEAEDQQADHHRGQPEKADLTVSELGYAPEGVAPHLRQKEWQHALDDQHQGERHEERRAHSLAAPSRAPEIPEELRIGIEHEDIALVLEARAVSVEAAIEGVELRILAERLGVDRRGFCVALALGALGVAVCLGDDHLAVPVRLCTDLLRLGEALRAELRRNALALGLHPAEDGLADFLWQLDALQPDVDDLDAVARGVAAG